MLLEIVAAIGKHWMWIAALAVVLAVALLMQHCYHLGMKAADERWERQTAEASRAWIQKIRADEQAAREKQREIAQQYHEKVADLQSRQAAELAEILGAQGADFRDALESVHSADRVCKCPTGTRVSGNSKAGSGTVCYTKDQLLRKIADTVAIGQECDREMIRFQALIEACK